MGRIYYRKLTQGTNRENKFKIRQQTVSVDVLCCLRGIIFLLLLLLTNLSACHISVN